MHRTPSRVTPVQRRNHILVRSNALVKRWPTALAVGLAALLLEDVQRGETRSIFAQALPMLPLVYLIVAQIQRPRLSGRRSPWGPRSRSGYRCST